MIPSIFRIGILYLFDDVAIEWILSSEQIHPHSDNIFNIFVVWMVGYGWVVFCHFKKIFLVYLNCLSS